ncbi:Uncharacterized protein Fot_25252 [Forsythia ovata]|uniref:Uncharacterized protein n=1 Tax=Forsythia ovata TaxID=205694 RepID=A0ABD1U8J4_9LAMI
MESPLWIAVFYFGEFVRDDEGKWNWKRGDSHVMDGLEIVTEISYKELYGPALVNDKTDTVESSELEREIETETLSFNNVQSQENDYWQDLEILPENDVRLQANDDNEVDENVDDYRDVIDINADDQNVESPAGNSKNTASSYSSGPEVVEDNQFTNEQLLALSSPITTDIAKVLDDPQLYVRCTLHSSPEEKEKEYVKLFVSGPRREDPIADAYLHEDRADGAAGDEEPDDIFEQVREDDPLRSLVARDEHEAGQSSPTAAPRAPLRRSRPCCEHENMLRQILEQIKKLTDQVDELKRNVACQKNKDSGETDATVQTGVWTDRVDGEAETPVDTEIGTIVDGDQEEDVVDTDVDTTVEGEVEVAVDTGVGTTVEGDADEAGQPRRRTMRSSESYTVTQLAANE